MADAYAALRHPFVRSFAIGRFAAIAGWQMINVAVGWQLYERTGDAWSLGLVGVVELTPVLLLMVVAGHAADRYPRRNIAIFAHALVAVAASGLALVSWLQGPTAAIYSLLALIGTGRAFASPSVSTILPQLLAPAEFANANAWLSSTFQLAAISGPAIGGLLIAATGTATLSFVAAAVGQVVLHGDAADAAGAATADAGRTAHRAGRVCRLPVRPPEPALPRGHHARPVCRALRRRRGAAADLREGHPRSSGRRVSAGFVPRPRVGALTMALSTTRLPPWQRPGRVLLLVVAGFGLATLGFGLSRSFALSLACLFFTGVFDNVSVVIRLTLEQTITPDHLRGRVAAINYVFIGFSNEFGAFESGATAALFGPTLSVVGGGVATLLVVAIVRAIWPELARIGPLHSLAPAGDTNTAAAGHRTPGRVV